MDLYFAPLACSLATRIALAETGAPVTFVQVDTRAKRLADGSDYRVVNPLRQVPALRLDDGTVLTENFAILQYVARQRPEAALLGPPDELHLVQKWLSLVGTELHKATFTSLLSPTVPEDQKARAREAAGVRFDVLETHLAGRETLASTFTVADAYLATVLNWCRTAGIVLARPSIAEAISQEHRLYAEEVSKRAA